MPWLYWIAIIVFEDFMYYWLHRVDHHVRLFWATHVTHHSSERFNFTVGIRSSVMEPLYRFVYFIPLALCGFTPIDIAFTYSLTQTWGILVHTERINKDGVAGIYIGDTLLITGYITVPIPNTWIRTWECS